VLNSLG